MNGVFGSTPFSGQSPDLIIPTLDDQEQADPAPASDLKDTASQPQQPERKIEAARPAKLESAHKKLIDQAIPLIRKFLPHFSITWLTPSQFVNLGFLLLFKSIASVNKVEKINLYHIASMLMDKPWHNASKEQLDQLLELFKKCDPKIEHDVKPFIALELALANLPCYNQPIEKRKLSRESAENHLTYFSNVINEMVDLFLPILVQCVKELEQEAQKSRLDGSKQTSMRSESQNQRKSNTILKHELIIKKIAILRDFVMDRLVALKQTCRPLKLIKNPLQGLLQAETMIECGCRFQKLLTIQSAALLDEMQKYLPCFEPNKAMEADSKDVNEQHQAFCGGVVNFLKSLFEDVNKFSKEASEQLVSEKCVVLILQIFSLTMTLRATPLEPDRKPIKLKLAQLKAELGSHMSLSEDLCQRLADLPLVPLEAFIKNLKNRRLTNASRSGRKKLSNDDFDLTMAAQLSDLLNNMASGYQVANTSSQKTCAQIFEHLSACIKKEHDVQLHALSDPQEIRKFGEHAKSVMKDKLGKIFKGMDMAIEISRQCERDLKNATDILHSLQGIAHLLVGPLFEMTNSILKDQFGGWRERIEFDTPLDLQGPVFDDEQLLQTLTQPSKPKKKKGVVKVAKSKTPSLQAPASSSARSLTQHHIVHFTPSSQLFCTLSSALAKINKINVTLLPLARLGKRQNRAHLARCDQMFALRLLVPVVEMLYHKKSYQKDALHACVETALFPLATLFTFLPVERAFSAKRFQQNQNSILSHSLRALMQVGKLNLMQQIDMETVEYRYPQLNRDNSALLKQFDPLLSEMTELVLSSYKEDEVKEASQELPKILKSLTARGQNQYDFQIGGAFNEKQIAILQATEKELGSLCEQIKKVLDKEQNPIACEKLTYVYKHLVRLQALPHLMTTFPHQRFLVIHAYAAFISGQYGIETIGHWLALKNGVEHVVDAFPGKVHHLKAIYCEIFKLDALLDESERKLISEMDVGKGFEYINVHCSTHQEVTPPIVFINELLKWSEATGDCTGDWRPESESKDASEQVAQHRSQLINYYQSITGLLVKLVKQHIMGN